MTDLSQQMLKEIASNTEQTVANTSPKTGFNVSLTGRGNKLTSTFSPSLELNGQYQVALVNFTTYNSVPNIDQGNNYIEYTDDEVLERIEIKTGAY